MANPLQTQTWKVRLLTPLHIGSGDTLWEGFDFVRSGKETVVLNKERIWEDRLFTDENEPLNLTLLRQKPGDLVTESDLGPDSPFVRYRMRGSPHGAEVRAQIKDAWLRPYIPGSTLKGAIRTILLWDLVDKHKDMVHESRLGDRREYAAQTVEQAAFGRDPNHDLLRALKISDSVPLDAARLRLIRAYAFSPTTGNQRQSIPINVEAIRDGQRFTVPVAIETYLFDQPDLGFSRYRSWISEELPALARKWADAQLQAEAAFFGERQWRVPGELTRVLHEQLGKLPGNVFMLQVGWGTGWMTKTVGPLLPAPVRERLIGRYRLSRGKRQPGDPFPKSRRLSGERREGQTTPALPLGWILVEVT